MTLEEDTVGTVDRDAVGGEDRIDIAASSAPAGPPRRRRSRSRLTAQAVAFVGVLAVAIGGIVAVSGAIGGSGPGSTALDYLRALQSGDAPRALAYGPVPAGPTSYLTSQVLGVQNSIGQLHQPSVLAVEHQPGGRATVVVQYRLKFSSDDRLVTDRMRMQHVRGRWRLATAAVSTTVTVGQADVRSTLAGTAVPRGPVLLFPGAAPVQFDTPLLELAPSQASVQFDGGGALVVDTEVSAAGRAAFGRTLDRALASCLAGTSAPSVSCPVPTLTNDLRAVPNSVRGRPLSPASGAVTYVVSGHPSGFVYSQGSVRVTGSYTSLDFDNVLSAHPAQSMTIPLDARFDPLHPDELVWM